MSIEHERPQLPPAEKFKAGITARFDLWSSIIDDSEVAHDMKDKIIKSLAKLKDDGLTRWSSLDDAFYGTISSLATSTESCESWKKKDKAVAVLFKTLRDDLWDFHREITS